MSYFCTISKIVRKTFLVFVFPRFCGFLSFAFALSFSPNISGLCVLFSSLSLSLSRSLSLGLSLSIYKTIYPSISISLSVSLFLYLSLYLCPILSFSLSIIIHGQEFCIEICSGIYPHHSHNYICFRYFT